jgi:hypothetical protein
VVTSRLASIFPWPSNAVERSRIAQDALSTFKAGGVPTYAVSRPYFSHHLKEYLNMFSLSNVFAAMRRLANALNRSAEIFEDCNRQLEARLTIGNEVDEGLVESPAAVVENGTSSRRRIART